MKLNVQRIFVGNLPTVVTEDDLLKRFSKYGKVQSTEIKRRSDDSVFAYVNLEADRSHINECLEYMSKRKWHGQHVKVELAKESFLDRLARERQQQQSVVKPIQISAGINPTGNFIHNGSQDDEFVQTCNFKKESQGNAKQSNVAKFETEDSGMGTCEVSYNKKLPMFKGILSSYAEFKPKLEETQVQPSSPLKNVSESMRKGNKTKGNLENNLFPASENILGYQESKFNIFNYEHKTQKVQYDQIQLKVIKNRRSVPEIKSWKSEEKRLKSIEEKRMSFKNQVQTVKRALAAVDAPPNKKIIFSDNEMSTVHTDDENDDGEKPVDKPSTLFDDESSDDEINDFKIKAQFEGRKGQKLLELQSKYANDKRFTLDERFYESDDDEASVEPDKVVEFQDEKKRQLNILQDVLGDTAHVLPEKREKPSNSRSMLRFDPLKADHKRFEVATPEKIENESKKMNVENGLKMQDEEDHEVQDEKPAKVEVSKEKFYNVTDRLKETLKSKTQNDAQFSLLEMFGSTEDDKVFGFIGAWSSQEKYKNSELNKKKQIGWSRNPFKYDSSDSEDEYEVKKSTESNQNSYETISENMKATSSFFFKENDARLKEGLEFITTAKRIGEEEFSKRRRELKLIIRAKIKNNMRKKRPWKKKLGGQKKKHAGKKSKH
ncbi:probable RNA-binding protein CG14230 isoform X1 [Schistocerca cancellata]|uniref:probable RNA-binding protein CG14230 isoform X1 n=1 Tax=Schistocerca cancellata TaxID=274614 RepID=UPI002118ED3A|nr:probable RNA-binding protein CG14230 isoform X1 [Schistocerca cancellata]XP_049788064.1 probable RNA-binding protein CG14230 isoform X1 [Schistocerca cancellata]XP_049788065.1 probable RNA-binding protein CG14230 isoform X1 [Schistocerca cancellata]XP_049788066.1 probable RNA-binding protein CG14230 isoform X1 [Schistocerca cancellata]XP_049788067.1 probable RNA-binding protein CG14230 isoform X1 [Schistocerca cancellata]XP_049788070.1 probable RNA-binding protein CG14230 isoform X1 [Schist